MGGFVSGVSSSVSGVLSVSGNLNASSSLFIDGIIICTGTSALQVDANGKVQCGVISGLSGSFNGQLANANLFVTDGTTTSTLRSDFLAISTSTANRLGLFNIDSTGSLSSSGTAQFFGLTTLNSGFISSASSTVNGPLTVAGPLNVSSTLLISGLFAMPSGFISSASSTVNGPLTVAGPLNASSTFLASALATLRTGFISSASSTVNGPLTVAGPLNASSTFLASGLSTLTGGFFANASSIVSSTLSVIGTTTVSDLLSVQGKSSRPIVEGRFLVGSPRGIAVQDSYAYVAFSSGFGVFDISDPKNILSVSGNQDITNGYSVAVSGQYAYVLDIVGSNLQVVDISNPVTTTLVGSLSLPTLTGNNAKALSVSGKFAYISGSGTTAFRVVDISDPRNPVQISSVSLPGGVSTNTSSLYVAGKFVYVTDYDNSALDIFNASDPTNPVYMGQIRNSFGGGIAMSGPTAVVVSGKFAYVAADVSGAIEIVDITNPASPRSDTRRSASLE
jgi:hypothetical protein